MKNSQISNSESNNISDELLDKSEARKALGGIGITKFYELLNSGQLKGLKIGKRLMIRRSEIIRCISTLPAYKPDTVEG